MEIKTKACQSTVREEEIVFTNYERIDEEILFEIILKKLKELPNVVIGRKQIGPTEDYYQCTIGGESFTLFYDIDYGSFVHSRSKEAREMIIRYFNE